MGRSYSPDQLRKPLLSPHHCRALAMGRLAECSLMGDESTKWCVSNVMPSGDMASDQAANARIDQPHGKL